MPEPNPPTDPAQPISFLSPGVSVAEAEDPNKPKRVMGLRDLILFYVVTGISLRWIATAASAGPSSIVIWIGAWLAFYTPLALSVIELSSRYPNEGGLYVWSKHAFGDFSGFMAAWTYWICNLPWYPTVLYFAASNILFIWPSRLMHFSSNTTYFILFSAIVLGVATLLNILGLDVGTWLHNAGALAMWIPAFIIIVMGLIAWHRFGSATAFTVHSMTPSLHINDMIFWSALIFAFGGCEAASFMGEEIKNARRTIPRALLIAGATIAICYIFGTVCVMLALPASEVSNLQGLMQAVAKTAQRVGFQAGIPFTAFLIALSNVGAAGAFLAATARLPFVAGIDRYLPPIFGRLHPRWHTPWFALLLQGVIGVLFAFLGQAGTNVQGAYDVLVAMSVITYFIPYLYLFASMIKLQGEPAGPEVIHVPGGKIVAIPLAMLGFATTLFTIVLSCIPEPYETNKPLAVLKAVGGTALLVAIGAGIYWMGKAKARKQQRQELSS